MPTTTLVKETGTGSATSNSYATAAELDQYALDRNVTLTATYGDQTQLLFQAMDYIEFYEFIGIKNSDTQALQWPRAGAVVDGYEIDSDEIPVDLVEGQMALAIAIDQGFSPMANIDRTQKKVKVDVIEIEYSDNAAAAGYARTYTRTLSKLVAGGSGGNQFRVIAA